MRELKSVETDEYSLVVVECNCGYHMGFDATFLEGVDDIEADCPNCTEVIDTAKEVAK